MTLGPSELDTDKPRPPLQRKSIIRRTWMLWAATFAVVIALAASVPLLYLPMVRAMDEAGGGGSHPVESYYAIVGLAGLVVIFCLYVTLKQRELNRVREALEREEEEKEAVRLRLSELSALFQVSTTLNLQLRLNVILEIIVRRVVSTLRAQQASIMIYSPEDGVLETRASYGLESEFARNARAKLGEGIAGWVAERKEAILLAAKAATPELGQHYKPNRNITSALSLPLKVGDRCVGVLNVNRINHPDPFKEHHREMLRMFAEHVGAVIDRAEAMERLNQRTRALEEANTKLSELNQMKDVFLSTASHELKTPLSSVIAYAELLEENADKLERDQREEFLRRLRSEAMRLMGLIEDILDLSRIESGKLVLRRRPVELNEVMRDSVETSRTTAEKHRVTLIEDYTEDMPRLILDEVKMRQVGVNLITNAIRFSPEGRQVTVRTWREPDSFVFDVTDHGPGIAPDETTHIFELFAQGTRGQEPGDGGLGIGLHLVKRISELHGAHVGVNSTPGNGSTFWVRLPLSLAESVRPEAPVEIRREAA
ncbi:MAG TPA: GAF domain-containing sensor histidine kinase [Candidatus Sulfotelmatobacter sp.]|nr:GAF domain-containing sensor histidine kinase [Candidatus Sulfotelmatobacter sp.]